MSGEYNGSNSPKLRKKSFLSYDNKDEKTDKEILESLNILRKEKNVSPFLPTLSKDVEEINEKDPLIDRFNVKKLQVSQDKSSPVYSPIEDLSYPLIGEECLNYLTVLCFNNAFEKINLIEIHFAADLFSGRWKNFKDGRNFYLCERRMMTETNGYMYSLGVDFLGFILDCKMDMIYTQKMNTHNYVSCERTKTFTVQISDLNNIESKLWIQFKIYFIVVYNTLRNKIETLCLFVDEIRYVSTNYLYDKSPFTNGFVQDSIVISLSNILNEIQTKLYPSCITVVEDPFVQSRMKKENQYEVISVHEFEDRYSGFCTISELIELPEEILKEDSHSNFYQYGSSRMIYLLKQTILHFKAKKSLEKSKK